MNAKRKKEIEKYWLKINKMHRELKYMKYDSELKLDKEISEALMNVIKIKEELERRLGT